MGSFPGVIRNEVVNAIEKIAACLISMVGHRASYFGAILLGLAASATLTHGQHGLVISEFLAINSITVRDDFGESSDYVEIYNGTPTTINLEGYYLTDSLARLTQWQFPVTNLEAGHHLLVWASGRNRRIPGAPLHTNFKLDGDGEALVLVKPDQVSVAHQYLYGTQILDRTYGLEVAVDDSVSLVPPQASARYLVPADNSLGQLWTMPDFDDRAWRLGTSGFGFDTNQVSFFTPWISTDVKDLLFSASPPRGSLFLRIPFAVENLQTLLNPALEMRFDDGFVAYLNGKEVRRQGISPNALPTFTTTAAISRSNDVAILPEVFPSLALNQNLRGGTNVLAIHAFNRASTDGDLLIVPEVTSRQLHYRANAERYFTTPSPGVANAIGYPGASSTLGFSITSRTFVESFELAITATQPAPLAEIRYTVDGSIPGTNALLFTSPLLITNSMQIRARLFEPGFLPGRVRTEAYVRLAQEMLEFSSDLPLILVHSFGAGNFVETQKRACVLFVHEPRRGRSSFTNAPDLIFRAGLKIRGSSSAGNPKYNWGLDTWDEDDRNREVPLLGMPSGAEWIFQAPYLTDTALINNPLASAMSHAAGRYASRHRFAELYLNERRSGRPDATLAPTNYFGIYNIMERITIGADRVAIDPLTDQDVQPPEVTGGYLLNIDRNIDGPLGFSAGGQIFNYTEPTYEEMLTPQRAAQREYLTNHLNSFTAVLNSPHWTNPVTGYAPFIDTGAWIDFHLINVISQGGDALGLSTYFYKSRSGPISFGPVWDFDKSFAWSGVINEAPLAWDGGKGYFYYPWWGTLFKDPNFWQAYIDRFQELNAGPYSIPGLWATIDNLNAQVQESWLRDAVRWKIPKRGGSQETEISYFKDWMARRIRFIETNFLARPDILERGGQVSSGTPVAVTAPAGATIYFTLDGSDPRALHGDIAPNAMIYTGPITVTGETRLVARSRDVNHRNLTGSGNPPLNSPWSGPVTTRYIIDALATEGDLVVSELNFDPVAPTVAELSVMPGLAAADFEFIEIQNTSDRTVDFFGSHFTSGVTYSFTQGSIYQLSRGSYLLLVRHPAAFALRYGVHSNLAGVYSGSLDNGGEALRLEDSTGNQLFEIAYESGRYPTAAGLGFTLVRRTPLASGPPHEAWGPSSVPLGSPGLDNPAPRELPRVVINEALANPQSPRVDAIELLNTSSVPANISGWYLTDDPQQPAKYRIPNQTILPPGGFWLTTESAFGTAAQGTNAFQLSAHGDQVWLFSADSTGAWLGYAHGFKFGASEDNISWGRHVTTDGQEQFVAQQAPTLGVPNLSPQVAPVVFREIMYHPPDAFEQGAFWDNDEDEYLEIENIGSVAIAFAHSIPGHPWLLRGAVDFEIPESFVLAPHRSALLVSFDPDLDPARLTAWRRRWDLSESIPVVGPFRGKMNNSGAEVRLLKPGPVDRETGDISYVVVDRVAYQDGTPWPAAADGGGASLERKAGLLFGNDPDNWTAALPSPGRSPGAGSLPSITHQPEDQLVVGGARMVLSVGVPLLADSPTLYQWRRAGANIPAGTNAQLVLDPVSLNDAGKYSVVVVNRSGSIESSHATVNVLRPATIVRHPESQNVRPGLGVTFAVAAVGAGRLTYQWNFNGSPIPGATTSSLSLVNVQAASTGVYTVRVTDSIGPTTSNPARMNVLVRPTFVSQPSSMVAIVGDSLELHVEVDGLAPFSYRWRKGGVAISGATDAILRLKNVKLTDAGSYSVAVTNLASGISGTNSTPATVIVMTDLDRDRIGDAWEIQFGYLPDDPNDANKDDDGDGQTTWQEFIAGTDPRDGRSYLQIDSIQVSALGTEVAFTAQASRGYTLQYRESLDTGAWQSLRQVSGRTVAQPQLVIDALPLGNNRLYRVVTPPQFESP